MAGCLGHSCAGERDPWATSFSDLACCKLECHLGAYPVDSSAFWTPPEHRDADDIALEMSDTLSIWTDGSREDFTSVGGFEVAGAGVFVPASKRLRVLIQNVPVYPGNTRTCFSACARVAGIHGDVLNQHTEAFLSLHTGFSACHTTRHTTPHHTNTHDDTHDDTHTTNTRRKKTEREKRRRKRGKEKKRGEGDKRREKRRRKKKKKRHVRGETRQVKREEKRREKRRKEKRREEEMKKKNHEQKNRLKNKIIIHRKKLN